MVADLNKDGFDITPKSVDDFLQIVSLAGTVVWNGPVEANYLGIEALK